MQRRRSSNEIDGIHASLRCDEHCAVRGSLHNTVA
jgi:hypothetical protein